MHETAPIYLPVALLKDRKLPDTAKLVWLSLHFDTHLESGQPVSPTRLARRTGLSRPTVRKAIACLTSYGWYPLPAVVRPTKKQQSSGEFVIIPDKSLTNTKLGVQAKLLYGYLQCSNTRDQAEHGFWLSTLSRELQLSINTVRRAIDELEKADWISIKRDIYHGPIKCRLTDPVTKRILISQKNLDEAPKNRYGETLAAELLALLVGGDNLYINAYCRFLTNRYTGKNLQLDFCFPDYKVALEFQGPQHFKPTAQYDAKVVARQRLCDEEKRHACKDHGMKLFTFKRGELTPEILISKLRGHLPLQDLTGQERHLNYLINKIRSYQRATISECTIDD